jgi:predicted PurR-regulated permease PerM
MRQHDATRASQGRRTSVGVRPTGTRQVTPVAPGDESSAVGSSGQVPPEAAPPRALAAPPATPVDLRSGSLLFLAMLAGLFVLYWARAIFIPIMVGVMLSVALSPIVKAMERWHIPRAVGAALLLFGALGATAYAAYALADDAAALVEMLPEAVQKVRGSFEDQQTDPQGTIGKVKKAAAEIERAATPSAHPEDGVQRVHVEAEHFSLRNYMWSGTLGLAGAVGQAMAITFIAYFLLASGNTFRRKLVRIAGPTFTRRRLTVQALDEITVQIQRYLLVQLFTSFVVGVASWLAFLWIGLNHAAVWGIVAGVLDLVPYIGLIAVGASSALVGFLQFGTFEMALLISGASVVIHAIEGYLLTPWLTSHASRMNPVAVFLGVLSWGWLWGIWGLLLGVPILMVVKAVCDRVDELKPIGELLGT